MKRSEVSFVITHSIRIGHVTKVPLCSVSLFCCTSEEHLDDMQKEFAHMCRDASYCIGKMYAFDKSGMASLISVQWGEAYEYGHDAILSLERDAFEIVQRRAKIYMREANVK